MNHIHVYFNEAASKTKALRLRDIIANTFPAVPLGKVHDHPIGPHPVGNFVVITPDDKLNEMKKLIEKNRDGLSVLIHPVSGDDIHDHADENVTWLGKPLALNQKFFQP